MIYDNPIGMLLVAGTETVKEDKNGEKKEERTIVREIRTNVVGIGNSKDQHTHDLGHSRLT